MFVSYVAQNSQVCCYLAGSPPAVSLSLPYTNPQATSHLPTQTCPAFLSDVYLPTPVCV